MKDFVAYVVKALVDHPEQVTISELQGAHSVVIEVRCHADDMGRVIGKSGKTIGAIRMLISSLAARQGRKALLEVVE
jgi:predicted RNA-binding protein YlqC (UPF0109 family)